MISSVTNSFKLGINLNAHGCKEWPSQQRLSVDSLSQTRSGHGN